MGKSKIIHKGIVREVFPDSVTVEMVCRSACAGCHAKGVCGASDESVRLINLPPPPFELLNPGDRVQVELKSSMGLKAVWLSYVIPLAVLMVLILSLSSAGIGELYVGLLSIAGVGVYYLVIYLLRGKLAKQFYFSLKKARD